MNSRLKASVQMHSPVMILLLAFVLIGSCTSTNVIQKSRTLSRASESFTHDLREIEDYASQITSSVVIAGDSIPDALRRFPKATVGEERTLTIENVVIKRIDKASTELVSKQEPGSTVSVPTRQLKSISVNGVRRVSRSPWLWLWLLLPLSFVLGIALYTRWWKILSEGCLNGILLGLGVIGTVITFITLANTVGLFSRPEITEAVDAVWWFAQ